MSETVPESLLQLRKQRPLIYNITNYVAMDLCANALLSLGASPVMSLESREARELSRSADALVLNTGCIEKRQARAMVLALREASKRGKPWVLDPAGVGLSRLRALTVRRLLSRFNPSIIRGNASEIRFLARDKSAPSKGLDSLSEAESALECAVHIARKHRCTVIVSGPTDIVTDGLRTERVSGGSPLCAKVTAMGCAASAIAAAFLCAQDDGFTAGLEATRVMKRVSEKAAQKCGEPASFRTAFLDELYAYGQQQA